MLLLFDDQLITDDSSAEPAFGLDPEVASLVQHIVIQRWSANIARLNYINIAINYQTLNPFMFAS